jgi:O-antigen ligase
MGREVFITYLKEAIQESDLLNYLFGYGPGQADVYLKEVARPDWGGLYGSSVNPHNDFLKLKFDYGLIGSLLMFLVFYSAYFKSKMGIMMFLYTIPLFLVDNSFIFIYFWFIALVLARYEDES